MYRVSLAKTVLPAVAKLASMIAHLELQTQIISSTPGTEERDHSETPRGDIELRSKIYPKVI